jgi:hypothetical protein
MTSTPAAANSFTHAFKFEMCYDPGTASCSRLDMMYSVGATCINRKVSHVSHRHHRLPSGLVAGRCPIRRCLKVDLQPDIMRGQVTNRWRD